MLKVAIAEDHAVVRAGLRMLLTPDQDVRLVGEAGNGREAMELVRTVEMDVLVMDLGMPRNSGLDVIGYIRARAPDLPIVIFTGYPKEQYAASVLRNGASAYVSKDGDPEELLRAIRVVAGGRRYITDAIAELLLAEQIESGGGIAPHRQLSEREFQVFLKLATGDRPYHIADALSLSAKTVSTYRTRLMMKLQCSSNSDLTYYAIKHQLLA